MNGILITGGANGIGRAVARAAVGHYDSIYILDSDIRGGLLLMAEMQTAGHNCLYLQADVSNERHLDVVAGVMRDSGWVINAAVNCAGILGDKASVVDYSAETWRRVLDVNLTGVFLSMQYELAMLNGHGSIINISSVSSDTASDYRICAYSASKAGVDILTRIAANENRDMFIAALQATGMDTAMNRQLNGTYCDDEASHRRLAALGETVVRMAQGLPAYHGRVMHQHEWAQIVGVDL